MYIPIYRGIIQLVDASDQELQEIIDDLEEMLKKIKKRKREIHKNDNQSSRNDFSNRDYGLPPWVNPFYTEKNSPKSSEGGD